MGVSRLGVNHPLHPPPPPLPPFISAKNHETTPVGLEWFV